MVGEKLSLRRFIIPSITDNLSNRPVAFIVPLQTAQDLFHSKTLELRIFHCECSKSDCKDVKHSTTNKGTKWPLFFYVFQISHRNIHRQRLAG